MTHHRDIAVDRCELNSSEKKLWWSDISVTLLILANVTDERSGESTDIADQIGTVPTLTIESCDENSEKTK